LIITQTPLRISFAGGGTDLPEVFSEIGQGIVVSTAVDKFIFVLVNRRQDNLIKISYSKIEVVSDVNEIEHNIIRECLKLFKINRKTISELFNTILHSLTTIAAIKRIST
jgi:D-glycero-alpha-D-manno-heptose-7-phosphate kinase